MRFHKRSRLRPILYILAGLSIFAGIFAVVNRNRPQVTDVFPEQGAFAIPAQAPLTIRFDRPVNAAAVEDALRSIPQRPGTFSWEENTLTFKPLTPWPRGETITVTLTTDARTSAGLRLADAYTWSFRTAPTLLAYLWPASGNDPVPADLYVLDPETGEVARLTESEYGVLDFSHSPDGLSLLLSLSNAFGGADVARFDLLSRTTSILYACGRNLCANPQFDPTGRWLAFENITTNQVWIAEGDQEPVLVSTGRFPSWSPAGLLLYDTEDEAYVVFNPESGERKTHPNITGEPAAWAPDGTFFLASTFTEIGEEAFASHILQYFTNISEPVNLTLDRLADDYAPAVYADGTLVIFARRSIAPQSWTPGRQIWVMRTDGREARQLTNIGVYNHTAFSWHPDNTRIAYVRSNQADLNEAPEIWLIGIDGSPPFRIVINGFAPAWLP